MSLLWLVLMPLLGIGLMSYLSGGRLRLMVCICVLFGFAAYLAIGRPELPDMPLSSRLTELRQADPASLSVEERLAIWRFAAREQPHNPEPYAMIGTILSKNGEINDAILSYRNSLRRDRFYVPALRGLADLLVRGQGGIIDPQALSLYRVAAAQNDAHSGFMLGVERWQRGEADEAHILWDKHIAALDAGSFLRRRLMALREQIEANSSIKPDKTQNHIDNSAPRLDMSKP